MSEMIEQVELHTERLVLRAFQAADASEVQRLAGDRDVSRTTLNIPHPYEDGMAEAWIGSHAEGLQAGTNVVYAITRKAGGDLLGAINAAITQEHRWASLGYWIGKPHWGQGFCTEAAQAVIANCFDSLGLNRVHAHYLSMNPASGRVMEKAGMTREGCLRQHVHRDGQMHDVVEYGILRSEYLSSTE